MYVAASEMTLKFWCRFCWLAAFGLILAYVWNMFFCLHLAYLCFFFYFHIFDWQSHVCKNICGFSIPLKYIFHDFLFPFFQQFNENVGTAKLFIIKTNIKLKTFWKYL